MSCAYDDEEIPLPLLRRSSTRPAPRERHERRSSRRGRAAGGERTADRMRPGRAGAAMGLLAGAAGLGVVHGVHAGPIGQGITRLAAHLELAPEAALPAAYLAAAVAGAVVGAGFAAVTRHLRRFVPLLLWALVFFASVTMLALASSAAYGRGRGLAMAPAILLASAAYALVVSFQLPLRKRS